MRLRGGPWEMEIRPERGGRITSLRLAGEELLDQGIGVDHPGASGFVEGGAWGWDEMIPNVEPTDSLPDHGEAWRLPWTVVRRGASTVLMRCRGRVVPWQLERRIELGADVHVTYLYRNLGAEPHPAYWCAHPLFRYEEGMEVAVRGARPRPASGESGKVFLERGSVDHARLRWGSGCAIDMVWDPRLTPYVGVWVCNGDLGGYRQIAIEPATGGNDRPNSAAPAPLLGPGDELAWWIQIRDAR